MDRMTINFVFNYSTSALGSIKNSEAPAGSLPLRGCSPFIPHTLACVQHKRRPKLVRRRTRKRDAEILFPFDFLSEKNSQSGFGRAGSSCFFIRYLEPPWASSLLQGSLSLSSWPTFLPTSCFQEDSWAFAWVLLPFPKQCI